MIGLINPQNGLLIQASGTVPSESEALRERERLRRELLRRIVIRETKRRAARGGARLP